MLFASGGATANYLNQLAVTPSCVLWLAKKVSTATNCIRVRRSSDSTEQDIGFSGNSLDTASMLSFCGAGDGFITKIYDQTGNGFDAVQATAANQPKIVSSGSSLGNIVWDGSNDFLKITSLTNTGRYLGIYSKVKQATGATKMILETSTNYNSNAGAFTFYADTSVWSTGIGANNLRDDLTGLGLSSLSQMTILNDLQAGSGPAKMRQWVAGSEFSATTGGVGSTTSFSTYDAYIGARAGTTLFAPMEMFGMAFYTSDTLAIRASIEALL